MREYANGNGNSGIIGFDYTDTHIDIQFRGGKVYRYLREVIGELNFLNMVAAAHIGSGLNSFINRSVRGMAS